MEDAKIVISKRAARFLNDGDVVNLGIGMPEMVANYLPEGVNIIFQSENGIMGMSSAATAENEDTNRSNAGGKYVTASFIMSSPPLPATVYMPTITGTSWGISSASATKMPFIIASPNAATWLQRPEWQPKSCIS